MTVIISIALATICFSFNGVEECHPALLGKNSSTPVGEFTLTQRFTQDPGYGGDVLQFHETDDTIFAVHRVWTLKPQQKREKRIKSKILQDKFITNGCVNVEPEVYRKLVECCSNNKIIIK